MLSRPRQYTIWLVLVYVRVVVFSVLLHSKQYIIRLFSGSMFLMMFLYAVVSKTMP